MLPFADKTSPLLIKINLQLIGHAVQSYAALYGGGGEGEKSAENLQSARTILATILVDLVRRNTKYIIVLLSRPFTMQYFT